jgi:hypothetical protein
MRPQSVRHHRKSSSLVSPSERLQVSAVEQSATREDYELERIIHACLRDEDGLRIARGLCRELAEGIRRPELSAHHYGGALASLFDVHPMDMLDELFSASSTKSVRSELDTRQPTRRRAKTSMMNAT